MTLHGERGTLDGSRIVQQSPWPFSQPEAGVQGRSLRRHWFKPNGRRLDEVMAAHLLEPAIVEPFLADEDRLDRRLRSAWPRTHGGQASLS